jgi:hypothetical protein
VFPGLVSHYFATADELVATAFARAATNERGQIFGHAELADRPVERIRRLPRACCTATWTRSACCGWTPGRPAAAALPCRPRSGGR